MRRLFWFGAGIAAGVALTRKVGETTRKATPAGVAENLGGAVRELAGAVGSFGADVRAGMSEREQELSDVVADRTGMDTGPRRGTARLETWRADDRRADGRGRARRAGR